MWPKTTDLTNFNDFLSCSRCHPKVLWQQRAGGDLTLLFLACSCSEISPLPKPPPLCKGWSVNLPFPAPQSPAEENLGLYLCPPSLLNPSEDAHTHGHPRHPLKLTARRMVETSPAAPQSELGANRFPPRTAEISPMRKPRRGTARSARPGRARRFSTATTPDTFLGG